MGELNEEVLRATGIEPRDAGWDGHFYLDVGRAKPTEEQVQQLTRVVEAVAKRCGYSVFCDLHDQPGGFGGSIYTLFCFVNS